MNQYDSFNTATGVAKARKKPIVAIVAAVVAVVAVGAGSAYAFVPAVKNTVNKTFMGPEKYLKSVYSANAEKLADKAKDNYALTLDNFDLEKGQSVSAEFTATLGSLPKTYLSQLGGEGFSALTIKGDASFKGDKIGGTANVSADGKSIATMNTFLDMEELTAYLQVPELTASYIKSPLDVYGSMSGSMYNPGTDMGLGDIFNTANLMSADDLKEIFVKYSDIVIDGIDEVEKIDDVTIGKTKCDAYKVKIDEDDAVTIGKAVIAELKNDKVIKKLFTNYGASESDFEKSLTDLESQLTASGSTECAVLTTYVDGSGCINGFEIGDETSPFISFKSSKDGKDNNIEIECKEDGTVVASVVVKATEDDGKYTGDAKLSADGASFAIKFTDLETLGDAKEYVSGTISVPLGEVVPELGISELALNFSSDGKSQSISCDIPTIVNVKLTYSTSDYKEIAEPSGTIYSVEEAATSYMNEIDLEKFLTDTCATLGFDYNTMSTLFTGVGGGYEDSDYEDSDFNFNEEEMPDFDNMTDEELQAYWDSFQ